MHLNLDLDTMSDSLPPGPGRPRRRARGESMKRREYDYVIVGSGPAGCACAAAILENAPDDAALRVAVLERGPRLDRDARANAAFPSALAAPGGPRRTGYAALASAPFANCNYFGAGAAVGGGSAVNAGALVGDAAYWRDGDRWPASAAWAPAAMERAAAAVLERLGVPAAPFGAPPADWLRACGKRGFRSTGISAAVPGTAFGPRVAFDGNGYRLDAASLIADETGAPRDARLDLVAGAEVASLLAGPDGGASGARLADGSAVYAARCVVLAAGPEESARLADGANAAVGARFLDHPSVAVPVVDARRIGAPALCAALLVVVAATRYRGAAAAAAALLACAAARAARERAEGARAAAAPRYRGAAFGRTYQLSYLPGQCVLFMLGLYGGECRNWRGGRPPAPLGRGASAALRLAAAVGRRGLRWSGGREVLGVGAVVATVSRPRTVRAARDGPPPPLHAADVLTLADGLADAIAVAESLTEDRRPPPSLLDAGLERAVRRVLILLDLAPPRSAAGAAAFIRRRAGTLWHPAGGCARGAALDPDTHELYGLPRCRVAGSASLAALPAANPMLACYAVGWRLGELLAAAGLAHPSEHPPE